MENIESPYTEQDLRSSAYVRNMDFLKGLEQQAKKHPAFDHPFLKKFSAGDYGKEGVAFTFVQIAKMVKPFTAAISALMGRAVDMKTRYVLFDNLYEEMGRREFERSHPMLYMKMLESMGISEQQVESAKTITAVRLLNDAIFFAILNKPFGVGCAWLGYGGELTIPNNFPYLVAGLRTAYCDEAVDMGFWERHGDRDQGHSDDATTLLAMNITEQDYDVIEEEVYNSLALRKLIWDECKEICESGIFTQKPVSNKDPRMNAVAN